MKFRFCGDGDCPDWVLAEIISTLSVMSLGKLERLVDLVARYILGEEINEDDIKSLTDELLDNGKSAIASIHFLLINAAGHNASHAAFNEEIQQLGLPKEHAGAMTRVLTANASRIRDHLKSRAFKIHELTSFQYLSNSADNVDCGKFEIRIRQELVDGLPQETIHTVHIERAQVKAILQELKRAQQILETVRPKESTENA